jgi:hypothetical protein
LSVCTMQEDHKMSPFGRGTLQVARFLCLQNGVTMLLLLFRSTPPQCCLQFLTYSNKMSSLLV